jgi:hypothetical protein
MFGGQHRSDEAETARAGWGDTSETRQPQRRESRVIGQVCRWTEKSRIKALETVGVVRDNAETGHVDLRKSSCPVTRLIKLNRAQRRSEPPLPTNYSNFVHEQNGHRRRGSTNGQRVTSEEVQGHAYPAKANSYQGTTNIRRSDCCREARAKNVPEPKILS